MDAGAVDTASSAPPDEDNIARRHSDRRNIEDGVTRRRVGSSLE